jgi:hypothetical protein
MQASEAHALLLKRIRIDGVDVPATIRQLLDTVA